MAAVALLVALVAAVPAAVGAQDTGTLNTRIERARGEARALASRLESATSRAGSLSAREQRVSSLLASGREREARIARRGELAARRLRQARARLKRAEDALGDRLVGIYKSSEPDVLTVILESDGWDDVLTRTEYLRSVESADQKLVGRVREVRDQVRRNLAELRDARAQLAAHNRRLEQARREIASVRAEAERARAEHARALTALRSRINGWVDEVARIERIDRAAARRQVGHWFDGYAIPKAIVMCESGGDYRAVNSSSGAGGAYQILPSTWHAYGGKGLPENASKAEQDRIAALIWKNDGPGAWSCKA